MSRTVIFPERREGSRGLVVAPIAKAVFSFSPLNNLIYRDRSLIKYRVKYICKIRINVIIIIVIEVFFNSVGGH